MFFYVSYYNKISGEAKTQKVKEISQEHFDLVYKMQPYLSMLYEEAEEILSQGDISKRYKTIYIPKRSGGKRRIDEPDEELKKWQRRVVDVFTINFGLVYPASSFAYISERNPKKMVECHRNHNKFFKTDIENFFTNCSLKFILDAMLQVYPFCVMDIWLLETIVKACMIKYDGDYGLPQGAPTSPMLSNIGMIPIDFEINSERMSRASTIVYTRYADDIYMSSPTYSSRNPQTFEKLTDILQQYNPKFKLNINKTKTLRFNQINGIWITGIMLNSKGNITIGYKNKKLLKATVWNFLMDSKNQKYWKKARVYIMIGIIGYWRYIEPEYVDMIICKYELKTCMNYHKEIVNICNK